MEPSIGDQYRGRGRGEGRKEEEIQGMGGIQGTREEDIESKGGKKRMLALEWKVIKSELQK